MTANAMKHIFPTLLISLGALLLLNSCATTKNIQYFQSPEDSVIENTPVAFGATIQSGDLLFINISATEAEAALPFNLYETPILSTGGAISKPISYLVDDEGTINFPVLGPLQVAGLTTKQLIQQLETDLIETENITNPIINIRFANFRVSVLGEVNSPGTFLVSNERISIIEALALAGDLTIYGQRTNVQLIRIEDGKKVFIPIDLTKKDLFSSPYYNLKQNDIIYVTPNKTRVNAAAIGPNTGVIMSSASLLITILALILK